MTTGLRSRQRERPGELDCDDHTTQGKYEPCLPGPPHPCGPWVHRSIARETPNVVSTANSAPLNNGNPATVGEGDWNVRIPQEQVCGPRARATFPTNPGCGALQRVPATAKDPRPRTRCTVMVKDVEGTATPAGARREGRGEDTSDEGGERGRAGGRTEQKRRKAHHQKRETRHRSGLRTKKRQTQWETTWARWKRRRNVLQRPTGSGHSCSMSKNAHSLRRRPSARAAHSTVSKPTELRKPLLEAAPCRW